MFFAEPKARKTFNCALCLKNPKTAERRKCQEDGFDNLKRPMSVEPGGQKFSFCPGKATWFEEIDELFEQCRMALETGILPEDGSFQDQSELFAECFPHFVFRWREKNYARIWHDVQQFTKTVLEAIFPKKGATKGGR